MRKFLFAGMGVAAAVVLQAGQVFACGGLVAPDGDVRLAKATTFVAWSAGVEHYVTSFAFTGAVSDVGWIVPLPAIPTSITEAGAWTLQRLEREFAPPVPALFQAARRGSGSGPPGGRDRAASGRGARRHRSQRKRSGGHRLVHAQRVPGLTGDREPPASLRIIEPDLHGGEIQHVGRARSVISRRVTACRC